MGHPFKDTAWQTAKDKHRTVVGNAETIAAPWEKASRLSGINEPAKMAPVPEQAVPQFPNDRSWRDVPYGSNPPESVDD